MGQIQETVEIVTVSTQNGAMMPGAMMAQPPTTNSAFVTVKTSDGVMITRTISLGDAPSYVPGKNALLTIAPL